MDDISDLLDRAAAHVQPHSFDTEALVARTRVARRRRQRQQALGSVLGASAIVGLSWGLVQATGPAVHTAQPAGGAPASAPAPVAPTVTAGVLTSGPPLPTRPMPIPTLPRGFAQACGKPGAKLVVRIIPITIPHRICNLSGVHILTMNGSEAVVPLPGHAVARVGISEHGVLVNSAGIQVATDATTGDVTIRRP